MRSVGSHARMRRWGMETPERIVGTEPGARGHGVMRGAPDLVRDLPGTRRLAHVRPHLPGPWIRSTVSQVTLPVRCGRNVRPRDVCDVPGTRLTALLATRPFTCMVNGE
ncbi:hypothetical protein GCM10027294_40040 [Marinactinospora endophytica]